MKITIINKLKEYFDIHKILFSEEINKPEDIDINNIKLLEMYIDTADIVKIKNILDNITLNQWYNLKINYFDLPLYHIVYFTNKNKYHSKGINVYAKNMVEAVEKFTNEYKIEPFYCTIKNDYSK